MGLQPSEVPNQRVNEAQHMRERTPQRYSNSPVTCQIIYWYHMLFTPEVGPEQAGTLRPLRLKSKIARFCGYTAICFLFQIPPLSMRSALVGRHLFKVSVFDCCTLCFSTDVAQGIFRKGGLEDFVLYCLFFFCVVLFGATLVEVEIVVC